MADPTTYHRITLKFGSPFPKKDTTEQIWSMKFSLSGAALTSAADAAATALDLADDVRGLCTASTSYVGYRYYPAGSTINSYAQDFAMGTYPGTQGGYASGHGEHGSQLEVCALARCYVKQSSKGRPVYLMKHIHDVLYDGNPGMLATLAADPLPHFNAGAGPNELVPVDPSTGQEGTNWTIAPGLYTRQLRRGEKGKA